MKFIVLVLELTTCMPTSGTNEQSVEQSSSSLPGSLDDVQSTEQMEEYILVSGKLTQANAMYKDQIDRERIERTSNVDYDLFAKNIHEVDMPRDDKSTLKDYRDAILKEYHAKVAEQKASADVHRLTSDFDNAKKNLQPADGSNNDETSQLKNIESELNNAKRKLEVAEDLFKEASNNVLDAYNSFRVLDPMRSKSVDAKLSKLNMYISIAKLDIQTALKSTNIRKLPINARSDDIKNAIDHTALYYANRAALSSVGFALAVSDIVMEDTSSKQKDIDVMSELIDDVIVAIKPIDIIELNGDIIAILKAATAKSNAAFKIIDSASKVYAYYIEEDILINENI